MSKRLLYGSIYLLYLFCLSLFSCKKNPDSSENVNTGNSFPIPASTPVNGGVSGRIIDENNVPVASATIECAGITTLTDPNGFFTINNASLDKYISTVTVLKSGYFKAYRSFCANPTMNFVNIKLLPKILSGTINSSSGGIITLTNATEINFQQNSFVIKSSGAAYSGSVNVYATYIDPTSADINATVPGSFTGRDDKNLYSLASTGMVAVDIESASGEALQLATNLPAAIKLPIPSSLTSTASSTIDTWSLDEQGIWKKEGTATKNGDHYEFTASHFSFWNCDIFFPSIYLDITLQDQNSNTYPNIMVTLHTIIMGSYPGTRAEFTDAMGHVSGIVPSGVEFELDVELPNTACGDPFITQHIGPFNENTSATVTGSIQMQNALIVSGIAVGCNGQPIASGLALVFDSTTYVYTNIVNGTYRAALLHCEPYTSVNVRLTEIDSSREAFLNALPVTGDTLNVPATTFCGAALNSYDGIYEVTGTYQDFLISGTLPVYPTYYYLISLSPNSFAVATQVNGQIAPAYIFDNGSGVSIYFGNFGLQATINGTSITDAHNFYGDPTNWVTNVGDPATGTGAPQYQSAGTSIRSAALDPSGLNNYDPVTKTMHIKYFMNQSSFTTGPRAAFNETWTYIGPR